MVTHLWVKEVYRHWNTESNDGENNVVLIPDGTDGNRRDHSDNKVPVKSLAFLKQPLACEK